MSFFSFLGKAVKEGGDFGQAVIDRVGGGLIRGAVRTGAFLAEPLPGQQRKAAEGFIKKNLESSQTSGGSGDTTDSLFGYDHKSGGGKFGRVVGTAIKGGVDAYAISKVASIGDKSALLSSGGIEKTLESGKKVIEGGSKALGFLGGTTGAAAAGTVQAIGQGNPAPSFVQSVPRGGKQLVQSVSGEDSSQQTSTVGKAVFGDEPVTSLQKQYRDAKAAGKSTFEAGATTAFSAGGDILPFLGIAKLAHLEKLPAETRAGIEAQASEYSGLHPSNVINDNGIGTLNDYKSYLMKDHAPHAEDLNTLISDARNYAQGAGIDVTSGSANEIAARIDTYKSQRLQHINAVNKISEAGNLDLGKGSLPEKLAGETDVSKIKKVLDDVVPPEKLDTMSKAIASTNDPHVVSNILKGGHDIPVEPTTTPIPAPKDVKTAIDAEVQNRLTNPAPEPPPPIDTSVAPKTTPEISQNPVQQVVDSLRGGKGKEGIASLLDKQKELYSNERSTRLKQSYNSAEGLTGREATKAQLAALKGELPRVNATKLIDNLKESVTPEQVNGILDHIRSNPNLTGYEPITAQNTIIKLFDEGKLPTKSEFEILQKAVGKDFTDQIALKAVDSLTTLQKVKNFADQVIGMPKAVMASLDFSGGGRQGAVLGTRFPKIWAEAQADSVKAFASSDFYNSQLADIQAAIKNGNRAEIYKNMNLSLASEGAHEEAFASNLAEKIPIGGRAIAASDRAYTLGLTEQRFASAEHILNTLEENGKLKDLSIKDQKSLGKFINTATGRGDLGVFEKHAQSLGEALFSPRLWKSRLDMLNPVYYAKLSGPARALALQSAGSFAAVAASVLGLAVAAGATVETDARSSDFLKIKIGNTRYDILGGFQQNIVFAWREITGEKKSSITGGITKLDSGKFGGADRLSILGDLIQNKENPVLSVAQTQLKGADKAGNKLTASGRLSTIGNLFVPLNIQDTYKTIKDTGSIPKGLAKATIPGSVGVGVGTYGVKDIQPSDSQKKLISKITDKGQQEAYTRFFQVTKQAAGTRQNVSDAINEALKANNLKKAQQLASDYNKQYASNFKEWTAQYGQYKGDKDLTKLYNQKRITLTKASLKARLKAIKNQ